MCGHKSLPWRWSVPMWRTQIRKEYFRTYLVVQWIKVRLPMEGAWVQSLVQEDSTGHGATKPVHHNYWACALEPRSRHHWSVHAHAHAPQEKPPQWEVPTLCNERKPEQSNEDPVYPKIKVNIPLTYSTHEFLIFRQLHYQKSTFNHIM